MKRITCFTESLGGGGAEHQIVILAMMLADKGYDVKLVTYASIPDHYDIPEGIERIDIGTTRWKGKTMKAFIKLLKCFHYFLWIKTDCIIAYRECANLRVLPPMLLRGRSIRVICSDRNTSTTLTFKHKLLLQFLYKRADYIVPNSVTETRFIEKHNPALRPKIKTIHNYTDLQQFEESTIPEDTSLIRFAVFSRYSMQKNPIGFAVALKELKNKTVRPFEVHWYGTQKNSNGSYSLEYLTLKNKVEELDIKDVLKLKPAVKNPALFMSNYHAVCLASFYEGFSNSIAEGICCGKPMLVSNVSDNSVMVHDGENGFLFNPEDSNSICKAFLSFFDLSYRDMCEMGRRSRILAESLFDKDAFIQQYIELIENR